MEGAPGAVELVEVGPRDGLQNEPARLGVDVRAELIARLLQAGLRRLEVASFVDPRRVPQMAGAEELLARLPRERGAVYIGLVLNARGFERARAAGVGEVNCVVVASDSFGRRNQGADIAESLAAWQGIARAARAAGLRSSVSISAAFGCPYEGEVPLARLLEVARRALEAQPDELAIADTLGVAAPSEVRERIEAVRELAGALPLRGHFHNTRNTALANVYAAWQAGVRIFDASCGGIGGCPFAPSATGNAPTEDVLYMLERMGVSTGVSLARVIETAKWLEPHLG
ncbi:MAG TPA: hydroxymethylglutaryl-CoA lyase, partial [Myxococcota bacterium]|nr:hydroxymethylglutaryl-CoA lyase [Myxococcota bacterium]